MKNLLKLDREMMKHYNKNYQVGRRTPQDIKDINELRYETGDSIRRSGGFVGQIRRSGFYRKPSNFQTGN